MFVFLLHIFLKRQKKLFYRKTAGFFENLMTSCLYDYHRFRDQRSCEYRKETP